MATTAALVASLSAQKQAEIFQKLKARAAPSAAAHPTQHKTVRIGDGQNFRLNVTSAGNLESLKAVATPRVAPSPGEVEVEVHASSLNFRDLMLILGMYPAVSGNPVNTMGLDWAGVVTAVGEGVGRLRIGDEVMGLFPADFSPYVTCPHGRVVKKPKSLTFEQAASIPTVFLTSYNTLHTRGRMRSGERVLIHSAAGGVGLAAIQIANWLGAEVLATAGNEEKRSYVRSLGVAHVFDSHTLDWPEQVMQATQQQGVDLVLNSLIGEALVKGISVLREQGRFIEIGMREMYTDGVIPLRPFAKSLSFIVTGALGGVDLPNALDAIVELFDAGVLHTPPGKVFAYADIAGALSHLSQGVHMGKVILSMRDQSISVRM